MILDSVLLFWATLYN